MLPILVWCRVGIVIATYYCMIQNAYIAELGMAIATHIAELGMAIALFPYCRAWHGYCYTYSKLQDLA